MVAMKSVLPQTTPMFVAALRLVPAGLLVVLTAIVLKRPQPQTLRAWAWISLFALVDGTLFQGFLAAGLLRTGAGLGSVMIDSQPLLVAAISCVFLRERIGRLGWLGLCIGAIGIATISIPLPWLWAQISQAYQPVDSQQALVGWVTDAASGVGGTIAQASPPNLTPTLTPDLTLGLGEGLMLLASLSMALGTVMMPKVAQEADPIVATGWHMVLGGLPLLGFSLLNHSQPWQHLDGYSWLLLGYVTVFGSALAYAIFFFLASRENLVNLSSMTFLTPVFALLFGSLLLSETLTLQQWGGVGLTLVGVSAIGQRQRFGSASPPETSQPETSQPETSQLATSLPCEALESATVKPETEPEAAKVCDAP